MQTMWRALTARKRGRFQGELPRLEARQRVTAGGKLAAFQRLFALEPGLELPLIFPHILAAPLHTEVATRKDFPLPALGLVHVANRIVQHRPLTVDTPLDLHVWVEGHRPVQTGIEFDLHTHASVDGVCCWEESSTVLSQAVEGTGRPPDPPTPPLGPDAPGEHWELPAHWGRSYARVSGDWNPIHLHAWTARPFGYSRPIAHGMALLAKLSAHLPRPTDGPVLLSAQFHKRVFLPARVRLQTAPERGGTTFVVRGARPHLFGWTGPSS